MKLACFNTQSPPQYVFNCCIITDTLIEFFYCAKEWACCDRKESLDQLGKYRQRNVQKKLSKQSRKIVEHLSGKWLPRESQGVDV